jgi:hypothetical protein
MLTAPRIGTLLGALLTCLALGACGGPTTDEKNAYVDKINAALSTYASNVTETRSSITTTSSPAQDDRSFDRFQKEIKRIIVTLRAIKAPAGVTREHASLIAVFTGLGDDVTEARRTMRTQTIRAQSEGQRLLGAATITANTKQDRARQAINDKLRAG